MELARKEGSLMEQPSNARTNVRVGIVQFLPGHRDVMICDLSIGVGHDFSRFVRDLHEAARAVFIGPFSQNCWVKAGFRVDQGFYEIRIQRLVRFQDVVPILSPFGDQMVVLAVIMRMFSFLFRGNWAGHVFERGEMLLSNLRDFFRIKRVPA